METELLVTTNPVPSTYIEENTKQWQEGVYGLMQDIVLIGGLFWVY